MDNDVFICYYEDNRDVAKRISVVLEENAVKTWAKFKDYKENDHVSKLSAAIRSSKIVLLIYTDNAISSNYFNSELDIAIAENKKIIVFNLDDSKYRGNSEFFLNKQPTIYAHNHYEDYTDSLLNGVKKLLTDFKPEIFSTDVYLSYVDDDEKMAQAICHMLEKNKIKCYLKSRDKDILESVSDIKKIIENAKSLLLIYSENSKDTNIINTDLDIAREANIPVLACNIDALANNISDSSDIHWLDLYPNITNHLDDLLKKISAITDKKINNPVIEKDAFRKFEKGDDTLEQNIDLSMDFLKDYSISSRLKTAVLAISVLAVILLAGLYLSNYIFIPGLSDSYLTIGNDGVSIDEYGSVNKLSLTTTTVNVEDTHCMVYAKLYDDVSNLDDYTVKSDYYDSDENLIDSTNIKMSEIKKEDDELLLVDYYSDKIITSVEITIYDNENNQVYNVLVG